jgi:serine/threonine-protein kinase
MGSPLPLPDAEDPRQVQSGVADAPPSPGHLGGGHYTLLREVGRGAAATVYEARDERMARKVAIKVLAPARGLTPEEPERAVARFQREARAIARLSHPNIVAVFDIGEQDGAHFLVMEFLRGRTLRARLDEGPPTPEETVEIVAQIASALDAIHAEGMVHRDIKPSNIMLVPDSFGAEHVKLLDFGIARQFEDATVTHDGTLIGSPAYMAPEQARGESASSCSDIWSLGVLIYEMLTGTPPFSGSHITSVLYRIIHETVPPLPPIAAWAQPVLDRALAKAPVGRYPSAGALASALRDAHGRPAPTAAHAHEAEARTVLPSTPLLPSPAPEDTRRPGGGASWMLGAASLAGVAVVAALVGSLASRGRQTPPQPTPTPVSGGAERVAAVPVVASPSATPRPTSPPTPLPSPRASAVAVIEVIEPTPEPVASAAPTPQPTPPAENIAISPIASATPVPRPSPVRPPVTTLPTPATAPATAGEEATVDIPPPDDVPSPEPTSTARPTPSPKPRASARPKATPPPERNREESGGKPSSGSGVLIGTWRGTIGRNKVTVVIDSNNAAGDFSGVATVHTPRGLARFAITGSMVGDTDKPSVSFWSAGTRSDSLVQDWDLGEQSGRLLESNLMGGKSVNSAHQLVFWTLSR